MSTILDLGTRWRCVVSFTPRPLYPPRKQPSIPIEQEAGWALDPVWTLWSREEYLSPVGNRTLTVQPVARRYADRAIPVQGLRI
jgi:hypothetical protein